MAIITTPPSLDPKNGLSRKGHGWYTLRAQSARSNSLNQFNVSIKEDYESPDCLATFRFYAETHISNRFPGAGPLRRCIFQRLRPNTGGMVAI
jgi:hypothetical protein